MLEKISQNLQWKKFDHELFKLALNLILYGLLLVYSGDEIVKLC